jgi:hypothetical protein
VVVVTVGRAALLAKHKTKGKFGVYMSKGVRVKGAGKRYRGKIWLEVAKLIRGRTRGGLSDTLSSNDAQTCCREVRMFSE